MDRVGWLIAYRDTITWCGYDLKGKMGRLATIRTRYCASCECRSFLAMESVPRSESQSLVTKLMDPIVQTSWMLYLDLKRSTLQVEEACTEYGVGSASN